MNVVNMLGRMLKGGKRTDEDEENRFVIRLKEADNTTIGLEQRIIEYADGSSVAEVTRRMAMHDLVWANWIQKWMCEALQSLEQRGFIRIENRPKSLRSCD